MMSDVIQDGPESLQDIHIETLFQASLRQSLESSLWQYSMGLQEAASELSGASLRVHLGDHLDGTSGWGLQCSLRQHVRFIAEVTLEIAQTSLRELISKATWGLVHIISCITEGMTQELTD